MRLRQVHPEDDPEGFKALRQAFERAVAMAEQAERVASLPKPAAQPDAEGGPSPASSDATPSRIPPQPQPSVQAPAPAADPHDVAKARLFNLLASPAEPPDEALLEALGPVLAPEARENISAHLQLEIWLADLIARALPRSTPLIEPAVSAFGWGRTHQGSVHPAILAVLRHRLFVSNCAHRAVLEEALRRQGAVDEDRLQDALHRVLDPDVLNDFQLRPPLEVWLARLIVETTPRSDVLLGVVIARMGWRAERDKPGPNLDIDEVVWRAASIHPKRTGRGPVKRPPINWFSRAWLVVVVVMMFAQVAHCLNSAGETNSDSSTTSQPSTIPSPPAPIQVSIVGHPSFPYPTKAARAQVMGRVTMMCQIIVDGRMTHCSIINEEPAGYGFGALSLKALKYERAEVVDSNGQTTAGRTMSVVVQWAPAGPMRPVSSSFSHQDRFLKALSSANPANSASADDALAPPKPAQPWWLK